jgi:pantoate--beta-alanine ligase
MKLFRSAGLLHEHIAGLRDTGTKIGFIPTMGALHEGHLQLIKQSLSNGCLTVCSIFVNPTQFNNPTDFAKYPKTPDADLQMLEQAGTDLVYVPEVADVYPNGLNNLEKFDLGYLETILEGSARPGHFQGVCQVMKRLLTIINTDMLFMGQKDYQQCLVINWLLKAMNSHTQLITAATVRQPDGLAMSSRNRRLSEEGRLKATTIFKTLEFVQSNLKAGNMETLLVQARENLELNGFRVDYVEMAGAEDLRLIRQWDGHSSLVCLIAAFLEDVRLIDNMIIHS